MTQEEKILWYWSGEADDGLSLEVEGLLESDHKAREYFDELGDLAVVLTDEEIPDRKEGLLDEVLETRLKVVSFRAATLLTLVATLVVAGFAVFLVFSGPKTSDDTVETAPTSVKSPTVPLSERMLSDSRSFRSRQGSLEDNSRLRRRWKKIRNPRKTT